jgi:hypothetical protein
MTNKVKMLVVLVAVVVIVLVFALFGNKIGLNKNAYSVVYLTNGEVYIGKLSTFPDFTLSDSYQLQLIKDTADPTKSTFQLNPTKDAVWAPATLHLNRQNVVLYGPLSPDSKIAQKLAVPAK